MTEYVFYVLTRQNVFQSLWINFTAPSGKDPEKRFWKVEATLGR